MNGQYQRFIFILSLDQLTSVSKVKMLWVITELLFFTHVIKFYPDQMIKKVLIYYYHDKQT